MLILKLCSEFHKNKIKYAIAGGYAVSLHGAIRGTVDIDIILNLEEENFLNAITVLNELGFVPRLPLEAISVLNKREFLIKEKNLIAYSFYNPSNPVEVIDILIHKDLKDLEFIEIVKANTTLNLISKKNLIQMKKESARPQDLEDVKALESL